MTAGHGVKSTTQKWAQLIYIQHAYVCLVAVFHDADVASSSCCQPIANTLYSLTYTQCSQRLSTIMISDALWYGRRVNCHFQYAGYSKSVVFRYPFWAAYLSVNIWLFHFACVFALF